MSAYDQIALEQHKKFKWKLWVHSKVSLETKDDLSTYYTPWVAQPCKEIAKDAEKAYEYTWKSNSVAVISDGSAVLWLGNIWWIAWLPVMEWKAILMKEFADIDAVPLILSTQDPDEIIQTVMNIAETFGAINLEDIKAPHCFYIEEELNKRLPIPVFHDDQHGTAIVVLAWLINALKLVEKKIEDIKIVVSWAGAAWIAIAKLMHHYGAKNIILVDSKWALCSLRENINEFKQHATEYNLVDHCGSLQEVIIWADVFVGVSKPWVLTKEDVASMNDKAIVFALSNPDPEITLDEAKTGGAYIYASWRSDIPNQINNLIAFPWVLRWALDARIQDITMDHKLAAALTLAEYVNDPKTDQLLPDPLDRNIAWIVADAVKKV